MQQQVHLYDTTTPIIKHMDTVLTDSLRKELKDLINEVLDERELQISNTTVTPQDYSYNLFDQDISINTEGTDVITFT